MAPSTNVERDSVSVCFIFGNNVTHKIVERFGPVRIRVADSLFVGLIPTKLTHSKPTNHQTNHQFLPRILCTVRHCSSRVFKVKCVPQGHARGGAGHAAKLI